MPPVRALAALAVATVLSSPNAQVLPPQTFFELDHDQATGWVQNEGQRPDVVAEFVVHEVGVSSLRLHFEDASLAEGSWLELTGLLDGYQQRLDVTGLAQWGDSSAYFNGDAGQLPEPVRTPG